MEWFLLYVGIGVCLAPWMYWGERKAGYLKAHDPASITMLAFAISGWPYFIISLPIGWRVAKREALKQEAREFETLLERVRREDRRRVRQEFAEFDKELRSGEPEPKKPFAWETVITDEWTAVTALGSPTVYTHEYYIDDTRLCDEPQFRVRDLTGYSKGGRV